ncbi:MAG: hypothetical protein BECKG1743D_GA0114223_103351, partial [Candidatus Kentron sp. G]
FGAWNNGNFKLSHYLEISTRNPIRANSHYRKSSGVGRIRLIRKACRSISDKV